MDWPADKIKRRKVDELIPYARNARTHSDEQVAQLAASIKEWGWTTPVLVDEDGEIIAGHGRVMAARKLGIEEVPTMTATGWTKAQKQAYVLADNQLPQNAGWDMDLLSVEMKDLDTEGFDLSLIGFGDDMLANMLVDETVGLTDEDAVPEVPENPVTVLGDVWILGRHKIVCGDATDVNCWEKLQIENGVAVFSSPPYNLGQSINLSGNKNLNKKQSAYETYLDNASDVDYLDLLQSSLNASLSFCDVASFNLQPLANSKRALMKFMNDNSNNMVDIITWDKGHAAPNLAEGVMSSRYEWIFIFSNKDEASRSVPYASWRGKWSNVYQAPPQKDNKFSDIHGATFPVHLPIFVIGDLMNRCRGVVDCFCGTGTTIIAAEKLGKIGYGIELDPKYCDVIVKRWCEFTGKDATLEANGKSFSVLEKGLEADAA